MSDMLISITILVIIIYEQLRNNCALWILFDFLGYLIREAFHMSNFAVTAICLETLRSFERKTICKKHV